MINSVVDEELSGLKLLLREGIGNELQGFKEQLSEGILKVSILAAENVENLRRFSGPCLGWHDIDRFPPFQT